MLFGTITLGKYISVAGIKVFHVFFFLQSIAIAYLTDQHKNIFLKQIQSCETEISLDSEYRNWYNI